MKVVICVPTRDKPHDAFVAALEAAVPEMDAAGFDHSVVIKAGSPYISFARSEMLRGAMDGKADVVVFIDDDVSFGPKDICKLVNAKADVCGGLYRFKVPGESYMGTLADDNGKPRVRDDGLIYADMLPAGFLKVTKDALHRMMGAYPELVYGPRWNPYFDLFNHGAHKGLWWGEDYAFSRRCQDMGEPLFIVPDLDLTHHAAVGSYPGNFHRYLMRQPGGSDCK